MFQLLVTIILAAGAGHLDAGHCGTPEQFKDLGVDFDSHLAAGNIVPVEGSVIAEGEAFLSGPTNTNGTQAGPDDRQTEMSAFIKKSDHDTIVAGLESDLAAFRAANAQYNRLWEAMTEEEREDVKTRVPDAFPADQPTPDPASEVPDPVVSPRETELQAMTVAQLFEIAGKLGLEMPKRSTSAKLVAAILAKEAE